MRVVAMCADVVVVAGIGDIVVPLRPLLLLLLVCMYVWHESYAWLVCVRVSL